MRTASEERTSAAAKSAAGRQADADFLAEVKRLANELKALVRNAARQTDQSGDAASPDTDDAEKALKQVDREIAAAAQNLTGGGVSLLV